MIYSAPNFYQLLHRNSYTNQSMDPTSIVEKPCAAFRPCLWDILTNWEKREREKERRDSLRKITVEIIFPQTQSTTREEIETRDGANRRCVSMQLMILLLILQIIVIANKYQFVSYSKLSYYPFYCADRFKCILHGMQST